MTEKNSARNLLQNYFHLKLRRQDKETFDTRIFDTNGKIVGHERRNSEKSYRPGDRLVPGIHVVVVKQAGERGVTTVVKQ